MGLQKLPSRGLGLTRSLEGYYCPLLPFLFPTREDAKLFRLLIGAGRKGVVAPMLSFVAAEGTVDYDVGSTVFVQESIFVVTERVRAGCMHQRAFLGGGQESRTPCPFRGIIGFRIRASTTTRIPSWRDPLELVSIVVFCYNSSFNPNGSRSTPYISVVRFVAV